MKEKMSIHRALAELKLIDARIVSAINSIEPTGIMQEGKAVNGFIKKEDFEATAKAKFQSIEDLIKRKQNIKSAIVKANSVTMVKVGEQELTIADAINFKALIASKKLFVNTLANKHKSAKSTAEKNNVQVDQRAITLAEAALSKDNVKINDTDATAITEPFLKANRFQLVDPLKVDELVEKMANEINQFEAEVDAVLSEVNATTIIEI